MPTDAHIHLGDVADGRGYPDMDLLSTAFSCTSRPSEWTVPDAPAGCRVKMFYGVHPWHSAEWCDASRERLLSLLDADRGAGVGEVGLDAARGDAGSQLRAFSDQMSIAADLDRISEIHMVSDERSVLDVLRAARPGRPAILHSFRSESYAKPFAAAGCFFSVGPRILAKSPEKASRMLRSIPADRLLLESDAPFTPPSFKGMGDFAERIASLLGIPREILEDSVRRNLEGLL